MFVIDKDISKRFDKLKFLLIVGIVFIHSHTNNYTFSNTFLNNLIFFISEILSRGAVPLFFAISGFLYFANLSPTKENFLKKYRSRFKTLFIPFIFFNLLIFFFFAFAQNLPQTQTFFSGDRPMVLQLNFKQMIELLFGVGEFEYPIAYQFWFIRDLIVLVLLSPLIYFIIKISNRYIFILTLTIIFISFPDNNHIISSTFFLFGSILAIKQINIKILDRYNHTLICIFLILSFLYFYTQNRYIYQLSIIFVFLSIYASSKVLPKQLLNLTKYSFFIFCIHEPLLSIFRKLFFKLIPYSNQDFIKLFIYFFSVAFTIYIVIMMYRMLLKIAPKFLQIITGNRL